MWAAPALGRWSLEAAESETESKLAGISPSFLLYFLPPGSCLEFLPRLSLMMGYVLGCTSQVKPSLPRLFCYSYTHQTRVWI